MILLKESMGSKKDQQERRLSELAETGDVGSHVER